jgi:FtsZ-binding cell division protein ZapB
MSVEAVSAVIGAVLGILTFWILGLKQIAHLAKIESNTERAVRSINRVQTEVHELKNEVKEDSEKQWDRISEHDVQLATISGKIELKK